MEERVDPALADKEAFCRELQMQVDPAEAESLAASLLEVEVRPMQVLAKQDDPADMIVFVRTGRLAVYREVYGKLLLIDHLMPSEHYGTRDVLERQDFSVSLVADPVATAYAIKPSDFVRKVSKAVMVELLRQDRVLASDETLASLAAAQDKWVAYRKDMLSTVVRPGRTAPLNVAFDRQVPPRAKSGERVLQKRVHLPESACEERTQRVLERKARYRPEEEERLRERLRSAPEDDSVPESWGEVGLVPGRTAAARFAEGKLAEMEAELQQTLDEEAAWMGSKEFLLTLIQQPEVYVCSNSKLERVFSNFQFSSTCNCSLSFRKPFSENSTIYVAKS